MRTFWKDTPHTMHQLLMQACRDETAPQHRRYPYMARPLLHDGRVYATNGPLAIVAPASASRGTYPTLGSSSDDQRQFSGEAPAMIQKEMREPHPHTIHIDALHEVIADANEDSKADQPLVEVGDGVFDARYLAFVTQAMHIVRVQAAKMGLRTTEEALNGARYTRMACRVEGVNVLLMSVYARFEPSAELALS